MIRKTEKSLVFISGASSGIGAATARAFAQQNYDLLLMARRLERLESLKNDLLRLPQQPKIKIFAGDICCQESIQKMLTENTSLLNRLSIVVNNAGLAKGVDPIQRGSLSDWDQMIDTNIKGLLYTTRQLLPYLLENQTGHIVNIGSVAGRWVYPGGAVYCATKFAVRALTEGLRQDLCGTGIRVTNIEPGMVDTEFSLVRLGDAQKANDVYAGMKPLTSEDIAETIIWCATRPPHVNIQELVVFPTDQAAVGQVHRQRT